MGKGFYLTLLPKKIKISYDNQKIKKNFNFYLKKKLNNNKKWYK